MRNKLIIVALILSMTGLSFAADESETTPEPGQKPAVKQRTRGEAVPPYARSRRPVDPEERRQMYSQARALRVERYLEIVRELEAIKKIAQEENAEKTVAALDALIEKEKTELSRMQVEEKKRREEFEKRMQERLERRPSLTDTPDEKSGEEAAPVKNEKKKNSDKK